MSFIALDLAHQTDPDYPIELDTAGRDFDPEAPIWCEWDWIYPDDDIDREPFMDVISPGGQTVAQIRASWTEAS